MNNNRDEDGQTQENVGFQILFVAKVKLRLCLPLSLWVARIVIMYAPGARRRTWTGR